MKYCPTSTVVRNPALAQILLNLSCCDNFSIRSPEEILHQFNSSSHSVDSFLGNFEQVRFYPLWHFGLFWAPLLIKCSFLPLVTFWPFLGSPFDQVQFFTPCDILAFFYPLWHFAFWWARTNFSSGFKRYFGPKLAQISPYEILAFFGPSLSTLTFHNVNILNPKNPKPQTPSPTPHTLNLKTKKLKPKHHTGLSRVFCEQRRQPTAGDVFTYTVCPTFEFFVSCVLHFLSVCFFHFWNCVLDIMEGQWRGLPKSGQNVMWGRNTKKTGVQTPKCQKWWNRICSLVFLQEIFLRRIIGRRCRCFHRRTFRHKLWLRLSCQYGPSCGGVVLGQVPKSSAEVRRVFIHDIKECRRCWAAGPTKW